MFAGVIHTVKCIFKKHDIADYLGNAGYNVSISSGKIVFH